MANLTCPACGYEAHGNDEIMNHMKQMKDSAHTTALKQKMGEKGGEAADAVKDKAGDIASGVKDKI